MSMLLRCIAFWTPLVAGTLSLSADCVNGLRPATPEEAAFHVRTLAALKSAVPAVPPGWALVDRTAMAAPKLVCIGENEPYSIEYAVLYYWLDGARLVAQQAEENAKRAAAIRALSPEKAQQIAELVRRARNLKRMAMHVRAAGSVAQALALEKESADLSRQATAVRQAHTEAVQPKLAALLQQQQSKPRVNTEIRCQASVNQVVPVRVETDAKPVQVPGADAAFQSVVQTVVIVGAATITPKSSKGGSLNEVQFQLQSSRPPTAVQNVVVTLDGPPEQVNPLLGGWSTTAIRSLIAD